MLNFKNIWESIHLKPTPCIFHCSKGLQTIHCLPFQLVAWSTVKEWEKSCVTCSWPVKISSWKINTDAAAACHWLFLFAGANIGQRTGFQWQSCCYTVISSERRHKERWMPHRKEQRRERERNGVRWHVGCDFCFSRDWDDCKLFSWFLRSAKIHLCWCWWFLTNPVSITNWLCFSNKTSDTYIQSL